MKKVLSIIILIIFCLFLYARYIEVNNFKIKEYTITNENIPDSFKELKIVHFSDVLYESKNSEKFKKIITEINKQNPDIVIFTGDLFKSGQTYTEEDYNTLTEYLNSINVNLFKFAVIGDNDEGYLNKYKDILYESEFTLLDNKNKLIFYKDITPINVVGITDTNDIESLLETDTECNYSLIITHKPDNFIGLQKYNINTVISGHSLGGVINIPFYGGLITKEGAKTYVNDYYKLDDMELYISNGIGCDKYNFRLFNTPSINVYRFDN